MLYCLDPVDYGVRVLNGLGHLPPLHLRRHVGPLKDFERMRGEWTTTLKLIGHMTADDRLLDMGCGCGRLALSLVNELGPDGSYVGFDVHAPSVRWCQKHLEQTSPDVHFYHADLSSLYNPNGKLQATDYRFPVDSETVTLAVGCSLFTHLTRVVAEAYLRQLHRVLAPAGRAIISMFLLNKEQDLLQRKTGAGLRFIYGDGDSKWCYPARPEAGIAYSEQYVLRVAHEIGLHVDQVIHGSWTGRLSALQGQDLLLLSKRSRSPAKQV